MAIDINELAINKFVESLRPKDLTIRAKLDFGYSFDGLVAEIFEIRPLWNDPSKILNRPFAKIRYYKSKKVWMLYWMRASGKWEKYEPFSASSSLDKIIDTIAADEMYCFFG